MGFSSIFWGGLLPPRGCWGVTQGCCCCPGGCCTPAAATMLLLEADGWKRCPQVGSGRRISMDAPRHRHPSPFPLGPKGRESRQHNPVLDSGESTLSSNTAPSESPSSFPNLHPPNTNPGLLLGSPNPTNLPGRAPGSLSPWCLPVPPPPWGSAGGCGWPRGFTAPPSQHPLGRLTAVRRGEVPVHL